MRRTPASRIPQRGEQQLHHAGNEHPARQRQHRLFELWRNQQCRSDQHHVQPHGRKRRRREPPVGIEDARREGHQRDKQDVREGQAQHLCRQVELGTIAVQEARGE